jgi:hypothetical protein
MKSFIVSMGSVLIILIKPYIVMGKILNTLKNFNVNPEACIFRSNRKETQKKYLVSLSSTQQEMAGKDWNSLEPHLFLQGCGGEEQHWHDGEHVTVHLDLIPQHQMD